MNVDAHDVHSINVDADDVHPSDRFDCSPSARDHGDMSRTPDQMRMQYAKTFAAAKAVEDQALRYPDRAAESRHQWPELWDRLDALFDILREPIED